MTAKANQMQIKGIFYQLIYFTTNNFLYNIISAKNIYIFTDLEHDVYILMYIVYNIL